MHTSAALALRRRPGPRSGDAKMLPAPCCALLRPAAPAPPGTGRMHAAWPELHIGIRRGRPMPGLARFHNRRLCAVQSSAVQGQRLRACRSKLNILFHHDIVLGLSARDPQARRLEPAPEAHWELQGTPDHSNRTRFIRRASRTRTRFDRSISIS